MANLLDTVKSYLTPELINQAAQLLGENESGIAKAAGGMAPVMLAGILNKANDANAMGGIFNLLADSKNAGFLDDLGSLLGGGNLAQNDPKDLAGNLMGSLFGGKTPAILNGLAAFAGIKSGSASSLLGMVGPLVMGVLGKRIQSEGLNLSGLLNLLKGQQNSILGALPSGLGSIMGLSTHLNDVAVKDAETPAAGSNWLWPLLLLLGLGAGIMYYMKNCSAPAVPEISAPAIDSTAIKAAQAQLDTAKNAVISFAKKLSSGIEIKGAADGIESQLIAFIEDANKPVDKTTWFNFDRLLFKTGSAEIDMEQSKDQLGNIAEVMKAFPKVKLKIGGYTDNTGNEAANMKLSLERAKATVAALEALGVTKGRLAPEGYGSQHPVASNDTEEGRAQNRRIAVRVTEK